MLETGTSEHGDFEQANLMAEEAFWANILRKILELSHGFSCSASARW